MRTPRGPAKKLHTVSNTLHEKSSTRAVISWLINTKHAKLSVTCPLQLSLVFNASRIQISGTTWIGARCVPSIRAQVGVCLNKSHKTVTKLNYDSKQSTHP